MKNENQKPKNPLVYPKNSYVLEQEDRGYYQYQDTLGITLRDYFASAALTGLCAYSGTMNSVNGEMTASRSYAIADEMLKQREL